MTGRRPVAIERYLTPGEAIALLHVDRKTLVRWADAGRLAHTRTPGGHRRYPESEIRALLNGGQR